MDHNDLYFIEASQRDPLLALLGRWLWFVIGPIVLIVLTAMIIITGTGWLTGYDLAFYVTVGADGPGPLDRSPFRLRPHRQLQSRHAAALPPISRPFGPLGDIGLDHRELSRQLSAAFALMPFAV